MFLITYYLFSYSLLLVACYLLLATTFFLLLTSYFLTHYVLYVLTYFVLTYYPPTQVTSYLLTHSLAHLLTHTEHSAPLVHRGLTHARGAAVSFSCGCVREGFLLPSLRSAWIFVLLGHDDHPDLLRTWCSPGAVSRGCGTPRSWPTAGISPRYVIECFIDCAPDLYVGGGLVGCIFSVLENPCVPVSFGTLDLCTVAVTQRRHHALIDMKIVGKRASVCGYGED